jgi:peptidyl-tRNA hydrolase
MAEDFARVGRELDVATISTAQGPTLLALPPRRKSTREAILRGLSVFTDARLPTPPTTTSEEANTNGLALTYVIRQGIMKSMGKAMAQGGHAALMCRDRFSTTYAEEFAAWREQGYGGRVYSTDDLTWEQLKVESECVVVVDAGLTQVDPGTETVLAFPPTTSLGQAPLTRIP